MSSHIDEPSLTLMPSPLTLLRLSKPDLDLCAKHLLRLIFFNPSPSSFFSYTETEEEVSLILDEESRKQFSTVIEELQLQSQQWRAIEIFEGPQALDQIGYIARFSEPLAKNRVDMIYISTYNTDLILVKEDNVERALASLEQVTAVGTSHSSWKPSTSGSGVKMPKFVLQEDLESLEGTTVETAHVLASLGNSLNLLHFSATPHIETLSHSLLKLFLFPTTLDRFFSYTSYGGQVTLILDDCEFQALQPHLAPLTRHEHRWNALHIQASPAGIDSSVVNYAANVLAQNKVSIYYLATLNDDYILVPQESSSMALDCLKSSLTTSLS